MQNKGIFYSSALFFPHCPLSTFLLSPISLFYTSHTLIPCSYPPTSYNSSRSFEITCATHRSSSPHPFPEGWKDWGVFLGEFTGEKGCLRFHRTKCTCMCVWCKFSASQRLSSQDLLMTSRTEYYTHTQQNQQILPRAISGFHQFLSVGFKWLHNQMPTSIHSSEITR